MSPPLALVVSVYVLPFAALFLAALVMEVYGRVVEWLERDRGGEP